MQKTEAPPQAQLLYDCEWVGGALQVTVYGLQGVVADDLCLDVSSHALRLAVRGRDEIHVTLPCTVVEGDASASADTAGPHVTAATARLRRGGAELRVRLVPDNYDASAAAARASVATRVQPASFEFRAFAGFQVGSRLVIERRGYTSSQDNAEDTVAGGLDRGPSGRCAVLYEGLLSVDEAEDLALACEEARWDMKSPDSVDGFPAFELYAMKAGAWLERRFKACLHECLENRLLPCLRRRYGPEVAPCQVLVRRYMPDERRRHPAHFDAHAFVTAVFAVRPHTYEGGLYVQGSHLARERRFVRFGAGDVLAHSHDLLHGVHTIHGLRHSVVLWFKDSRGACVENTSPWYLHAAEAGDSHAMYNLAANYEWGRFGYAQDLDAAQRWYRDAVRLNHAMAMNALGALLERRSAGAVPDECFELFVKAADAGLAKGALNFARLALGPSGHGDGGRSAAKAVRLLRRAAEEDDAEAQVLLGRILIRGRGGCTPKPEEGERWLFLGAEQGDPEAQLHLGLAHAEHGNMKEAYRWYKAAAGQGHPKAIVSLCHVTEALAL
mmetsp:Transcript_41990/g.115882  ORF Transcript_41990/g.115882 Transcript_41990/m.115882 type:complete len:555 (-) Transcript_41990:115-1779(-)